MSAKKKYLFYVTLSYSYSVLRPIESVLKERGYSIAWFIPDGSEAKHFISDSDNLLSDMKQVRAYNADAVLAPGNYIPDFFPGIKVQVFHGFDSGKKNKFNIRGFFDLYCTQGPNITDAFNNINDGTCEVIETGWSKLDPLFSGHPETNNYQSESPVVFYAPTFSPKLTSTYALYPEIKKLIKAKNWHWLIKLHPKASTEEIAMFKVLAGEKVQFIETSDIIPLLQAADVLLSDTSSILAEYALQRKPVVAFNNRRPESWLVNFNEPEKLEEKLEYALQNKEELLSKIDQHCQQIHPYRDGASSERVIQAIDDLVERGICHLKAKPLNLIRRLKMRKKLKYYRW
ncbi:CDP-glycerol glycerophosphotransferase family protein [Thalassotalea fonticola]|uniref:CDP-glycerol glycerophosphotransferase family protein n=1 Tax=Thalassotalea fonticola TaxID=3065649 RepID=A0ABZ0GUQ9_9GAMM|nr:CDP-glycerol glycerophosphotransferase family protein [Colwelliaceae bacterium S1-1]